MVSAILSWLIKAPTPWDVLASLAAFGSWFVAWRQWRATATATTPIYDPAAHLTAKGLLEVRLGITNRSDHALRVTEITPLEPRQAFVTQNSHTEGIGGLAWDEPAERSFCPDRYISRAGEDPQYASQFNYFGAPDRTTISFVTRLPEGTKQFCFRVTIAPGNADLKTFSKILRVRVPQLASSVERP